MKFSEMMFMLEQDNDKEFRRKNVNDDTERAEVGMRNGGLTWIRSTYTFVITPSILAEEWILTTRPVSFMEAFKAIRQDRKDVYCIYDGVRWDFREDDHEDIYFNEDHIDMGEWYIGRKGQ